MLPDTTPLSDFSAAGVFTDVQNAGLREQNNFGVEFERPTDTNRHFVIQLRG